MVRNIKYRDSLENVESRGKKREKISLINLPNAG
jgi:hypothetical protein